MEWYLLALYATRKLDAASQRGEYTIDTTLPSDDRSKHGQGATNPARLILHLTVSVFVSEFLVMLILMDFDFSWSTVSLILQDAGLLVLLVAPAIYVLAFRPLVQELRGRKQAETALEGLFAERTAELNDVQNALQSRERSEHEMQVLMETTELLEICKNEDEAYNIVAALAPRLFDGESGALFVFRNSKNLVERVATWGDTPPAVVSFDPDDCWAMRLGRAHTSSDNQWSNCCRCACAPPGSVCVPMSAQGETLGVMYQQHHDLESAPKTWRNVCILMAEGFARSLANIRLRETLRHQAIRDELTGLYNRRYMQESLPREISRAQRAGTPLAAIMLDIDHFKRFNDTHGHLAGDALLKALGKFLNRHVRDEDIACRYGGEEILLIYPDITRESAQQRAEKLRTEIKNLNTPHFGQLVGSTTVSMGVALFPKHGSSAEELIAAADAALYLAKASGRDRVVMADVTSEHSQAATLEPTPSSSGST